MDPVDINELVPIEVPKHYNLFQVITPMVLSSKEKNYSAYATLDTNMEDIQVSDLEYLEEPDIMAWSYLNIMIRKKLIIV